MIRLHIIFSLSVFFAIQSFAAVEPVQNVAKLPARSEQIKFKSIAIESVPFLEEKYIGFTGIQFGLKNGYGFETTLCRKLSRYLCAGARVFVGSLNSYSIVRPPLELDTPAKTSDVEQILTTPEESWFSFVPEVGFSIHTQILSLNPRWSESAWVGFGPAFIGPRNGWAISFEPGISQRFKQDSTLGWTFRVKYTFGWLYANNGWIGTVPYDWVNMTAGIFYVF